MSNETQLRDMKGLGPKSCEMLTEAGITTLEQLRQLGSVAAYVKTRQCHSRASLNLLWALESVLTDIPWQQIAKQHRTSLLLALDQYEQ